MQPIIKITNLSKQYRLGTIGTGTISNDLKRWWYKARGKEDPFLKIGESNDRSTKGNSDYVWALKDINLEVMPGEILGIIGKNGAGKSTLLKILSKVTGPTTGSISFNGRIGSLLEVGTGFHPELTGRENIYLNGAILGMTKTEIKSKLDEIIDFSGCERYIDTPVKRYSSGMTVRLGFAIAAHLEPEILVVDEVLAVGDAEFQKKAIGKMQDVSQNEGRTVLFVSHNMAAIKNLCTTGILMDNGKIFLQSNIESCTSLYLNKDSNETSIEKLGLPDDKLMANGNIYVQKIKIQPIIGNEINIISGFKIVVEFEIKQELNNIDVTYDIVTVEDIRIMHQGIQLSNQTKSDKSKYKIEATINSYTLNAGIYQLNLIFGQDRNKVLLRIENAIRFEVHFATNGIDGIYEKLPGLLSPNLNWNICKLN